MAKEVDEDLKKEVREEVLNVPEDEQLPEKATKIYKSNKQYKVSIPQKVTKYFSQELENDELDNFLKFRVINEGTNQRPDYGMEIEFFSERKEDA